MFVLPLVQCKFINSAIPSARSLRTLRVLVKDDRRVFISDSPFSISATKKSKL
jgi:hypothetical protein